MKKVATQSDLAAIAKVNRKKPTREDFKSLPGYYERPKAGGGFDWGVKFKPNENGRPTRTASAVQELMTPFMRADTERMGRVQQRIEKVQMRDGDGGIRHIETGRADEAARRNGWGHHARYGGLICKAGPGGMLFRMVRDAWEPTGKLTVGIMGKPCPRKGIQFDPDGHPWRWFRGAWVVA